MIEFEYYVYGDELDRQNVSSRKPHEKCAFDNAKKRMFAYLETLPSDFKEAKKKIFRDLLRSGYTLPKHVSTISVEAYEFSELSEIGIDDKEDDFQRWLELCSRSNEFEEEFQDDYGKKAAAHLEEQLFRLPFWRMYNEIRGVDFEFNNLRCLESEIVAASVKCKGLRVAPPYKLKRAGRPKHESKRLAQIAIQIDKLRLEFPSLSKERVCEIYCNRFDPRHLHRKSKCISPRTVERWYRDGKTIIAQQEKKFTH